MTASKALRWWNALPENFHQSAFEPVMPAADRWKVRATAAIDLALRTGTAGLVGAAMAPRLGPGDNLARELEALAFYRDLADRTDRDEIFAPPPRHMAIEQQDAPLLAYHPPNIPHRMLRFTSPHVALNPAMREAYAQHERSHRTVAQHWYHPDGPRPTLVFLHGFLADHYWFNSLMFSLHWFWRQGYDVLLMTLPFHGERRGALDPFSGFGLFAHGLAHFNEAMLQAVCDVRVLVDWLEERGTPSIGISGLSLGGYLSALSASVDDRFAFCIPNAPVVTPADMMLEWAPVSWLGKRLLARNGLTIRDVRHGLAVHCPLSWHPRLPTARLLVIGGAGDRFVAPRYVELLHRHWDGSAVHWFPGNHVIHLHQEEYLRLMLSFMNAATGNRRKTA